MQPKVFFTSFALCVRSTSTNVSSFIGQGHVYISVQPDQSPYFLNRIRQPAICLPAKRNANLRQTETDEGSGPRVV